MFWKMTGLSSTSPVDTILEKENYTLEELLDEDEIIQECKALNTRLINFLRERAQVEQLLHYIVDEAPDDADNRRIFKFPFIACEIFTCELDIILRTLVEDEELMDLLFSFLKPDHPHSTLLSGYFSKVVTCLMFRKMNSLMNYVKGHQEIFRQLVDLIGITSMMEVLIRLIGADENMCSDYDALQWLEDTNLLEMIVDKFSSSDSPEVHANTAEVLCAITRYAPQGLVAKVCSPSFVGRLFRHALEHSRPKSVLVHSLSVCMALLDPKRLITPNFHSFRSQLGQGSVVSANPETIDGMLESLGDLFKLLDVSPSESTLPTTYGSLNPPLGKHRLKIVEFISVLLTVGSEAAEKELIRLGAIERVINMFFEYPFNNFLHHYVENIVSSCLESKRTALVEHLLHGCDIIGKIIAAEKLSSLSTESSKPTVSAEGRAPPRIGNVGHMTRITNKLVQLQDNNSIIQTYLQENNEWAHWHANVLLKRNSIENVFQWACGRPSTLQDRPRDSDDEDFRDRDYDVAALANNLSQAFHYGIYNNDSEEAHGALERDDEDVYFDDESAEVVISSLRLGDDQDSSLFTNSNWFAFEDDGAAANDGSAGSFASSPSLNSVEVVLVGENENQVQVDTSTTSLTSDPVGNSSEGSGSVALDNNGAPLQEPDEGSGCGPSSSSPSSSEEKEKSPEWVEWRESSDAEGDLSSAKPGSEIPNGDQADKEELQEVIANAGQSEPPPESTDIVAEACPDSGTIDHSSPSPPDQSSVNGSAGAGASVSN